MLSYKSDTFQTTRKELVELQKNFKKEGVVFSQDTIKNYLDEKNISLDDFKEANQNFKKFKTQGKRFRPEGFRLGRIVAGAVGEAGRDIKDIASGIAPKSTEAISATVSKVLPDQLEKDISSFFDPYMGDSEVDRFLADIGSYVVPGGLAAKGISLGAKGIKLGKSIGPKAARLRKLGRLGKYGAAGAIGATIAESDVANENIINSLADLSYMLGFENATNFLDRMAVDPTDSKAKQYFDALINNALLAGLIPAGHAFTKPLTRQKALAKIAQRAKKAEKKVLQVDSTPVGLFGLTGITGGGKFGRWLNKGFSPDRGTDAFTLENILFRERAPKQALEEIEGLTTDLMRAVNKSATVNFPKEKIDNLIQEVLETRSSDAMRQLKQNAPEVAQIVSTMNNNLRTMRTAISKKLTNEDLLAKYDPQRKKIYLNRSYRIYDDPNFSKDIKDIPPQIRKDVEDYLRLELKIPEDKIKEGLIELLSRGKAGEKTFKIEDVFSGKTNWGTSTSKTHKKRTKLAEESPEIRALWGEVKDPYKNYANTYEKLAQIKSESDFVTDMANYFRETGLGVTREQLQKKGVVGDLKDYNLEDVGEETLSKVFGRTAVDDRLVPIKNKKTGKLEIIKAKPQILNPLENLYVNPEYKKFIKEGTDIMAPTNPLMKNWMRYKVTSQTAKTVYNPATHGRNTLGNMILMVANGMNPFALNKEGFQAAYKKLTGKSNEELGKRLGLYQKYEIIDSGVKQETLRKASSDVFNYKSNKVVDKVGRIFTGEGKKNPLRFTQNLYQIEDDFFKIMHFEKTIKDLKKVFPEGTSIEKIEKEAARRTRELMPNYGLVGRKLKELRYLPVGDFIAFPAEMIRVSANLGKRTLKDITGRTADELGITNKKAREKLRNMGYKRLAGMTVAGTAGEEAMNYTANRLGLTSNELKAIENLGPDYARGSPKIFLSGIDKDKNNHYGLDYINLGPIDPFNYLKAPALMIGRELASLGSTGKLSNDATPNLQGAFFQALGPFLGTSMATDAIMKAIQLGEEDGMSYEKKFTEIGAALVDTITPGFLTTIQKGQQYRKSKELRKERYDPITGKILEGRGAVSNYDYTMPEVEFEKLGGLPRWFGIRPQRLDITAGMRRQIFPLTRGMDSFSETSDFMNNPNAPRAGPERDKQFIKAYIEDQKNRLSYFKRLKRITDSYDNLGLDYEDIILGLSKEGLKEINTKDTIKKMDFASRNAFLPSFIPKGLIPYAYEYTGGELPLDTIGNIQSKLLNLKIYKE
jgi:hypothetical protein